MNERIGRVDGEKVSGPISYGAMSNPLLSEIYQKFGKTAFGRSSALMEFEHFLKRIGAGGDTCLEIGTYHGITAVVLSQFFKRVVCISLDDNPAKLMKHDIVRHLGITNIRFFDVRNNDEKAALIKQLDFDFCYSDGDHTSDTQTDYDLVKHCGRVLFHEYWPIQAPVWNLVNSLPQNEVTRAQFDCFAYWERTDLQRPALDPYQLAAEAEVASAQPAIDPASPAGRRRRNG